MTDTFDSKLLTDFTCYVMLRHVTHNYIINFVEGLLPLASEALWVYFFTRICYHDIKGQAQRDCLAQSIIFGNIFSNNYYNLFSKPESSKHVATSIKTKDNNKKVCLSSQPNHHIKCLT